MNSIKSNAIKAVILIALFIPFLISGSFIYNYFSNLSSDSTGDLEVTTPSEKDSDNIVNTPDIIEGEESPDSENTSVSSNESTENTDEVESAAENNVVNIEDDTVEITIIDNGNTIEEVEILKELYSDKEIKLLQETYLTLYFEPQSFKISSGNAQVLEKFIETAKQFPDESISIEGHANGYPNFENSILEQAVSSDRSHAVEALFLENDIEKSRITIYNCGSSQPLALDEENQALNDRIEIYFRDYNAKGNKDK